MDVMPQQPPQSPDPSRPPLDVSDLSGASALSALADPASLAEPPPVSLRTTLRRVALGTVAAAVLVTGAVVAVPDDGKKASRPSVPGPVSRALTATAAGAPASLSDLTALIGDRQRWVGTHPSDARSWAVLGAAYVEWGRRSADAAYYGRAEQALNRSLNVQPGENGNTAAWVGLAALADARHDFVTAKKWGETVRARQPKEWAVYPALIDAYSGLGDYKSASTAVERFTALRAGVPALMQTARMYLDHGWREDALANARDAADRATTPAQKAECLYLLGELAWERGEPAEAVAQYGAALRTDRAHHPSLAGRARALAALGRTDEARRDYRAALAHLPRPEYMLELGELYESLGLDGEAAKQYARLREALAQDDGQGVDNALLRGRFEADHGDPAAAVGLLDDEWARSHRSAAVADALGWALHRSGDPSAALEYAARAVDTGGQNASYAYHLGVIQKALRDHGPARRNLEEALRSNPRFSPLAGPAAQEALDDLVTPLPGGPQDMQPAPEPGPEPTTAVRAPAPQQAAPAAPPAPTARPDAPKAQPKPAPQKPESQKPEPRKPEPQKPAATQQAPGSR
ncbi:tetratricopeptide repeat protein [Streptomyces sp. NBC_01591]|uniref:tetratricopeptide repeat protein n=1 Tax=Streptomyces sp. NBC_01591 TaxID=2975888 RepID=UPI002DDA4D7D|nr:tetratricopeptide repeat protein [Streptomyces sp. NBC_01591]WSD68713.1 tetratricopeptide repeat protein [Streptomyces sp. NBC_01591]